jgi:hypothetical protein
MAQFLPGQQVYLQRPPPSGGVELGVVKSQGGQLLVANEALGWQYPLNPAIVWLPAELRDPRCETASVAPQSAGGEFIKNAFNYAREKMTMSLDDVSKYFGEFGKSLTVMRQTSGNCYAMAGFEALRNAATVGPLLFATSCRLVPSEANPSGIAFRLPLGDPAGTERTVLFSLASSPREEAVPLTYMQNRMTGKVSGVTYGPERRNAQPPLGPKGFQALEEAIVQEHCAGSRIIRGEGGDPARALLQLVGGTQRQNVYPSSFDAHGTKSMAEMPASENMTERAMAFLRGYSNGRQIATAGTPDGPGGDKNSFSVGSNRILNNHAYSILAVQCDARGEPESVTVSESNTPGRNLQLTTAEFMHAFNCISAVQMDYRAMFPRNSAPRRA